MINLKQKGLANAIEANGQSFLLNTDFETWLNFPDIRKAIFSGNISAYRSLFADQPAPLTRETIAALDAFYYTPKEVPRSDGGGEAVLDYDIDADYIYAAFMQAYGIDLKEKSMHWHKFSALMNGLPDDVLIVKIMQWRGYDGSPKDVGYKEYMKLKQKWALPLKMTDEEIKAKEEFEALF